MERIRKALAFCLDINGDKKQLIYEQILVTKCPHANLGDYSIRLNFRFASEGVPDPKSPLTKIMNACGFPIDNADKNGDQARARIVELIQMKIGQPGFEIGSITLFEGILNIFVSRSAFFRHFIDKIERKNSKFGSSKVMKNNNPIDFKIVIEHTSSNPNSPLHIGNLRNVMIGAHMSRLFKFLGYNTKEYFLVNDLGAQIGLTALGYSRLPDVKYDRKIDHVIGSVYAIMNTFNELQLCGINFSQLSTILDNEVDRVICFLNFYLKSQVRHGKKNLTVFFDNLIYFLYCYMKGESVSQLENHSKEYMNKMIFEMIEFMTQGGFVGKSKGTFFEWCQVNIAFINSKLTCCAQSNSQKPFGFFLELSSKFEALAQIIENLEKLKDTKSEKNIYSIWCFANYFAYVYKHLKGNKQLMTKFTSSPKEINVQQMVANLIFDLNNRIILEDPQISFYRWCYFNQLLNELKEKGAPKPNHIHNGFYDYEFFENLVNDENDNNGDASEFEPIPKFEDLEEIAMIVDDPSQYDSNEVEVVPDFGNKYEKAMKQIEYVTISNDLHTRYPDLFDSLRSCFNDNDSVIKLAGQLNKAYENKEPDAVRIIRKMTNDTLRGCQQTLDTYGVKHDRFDFESEISWDGTSNALISLFQQSPFFHPQTQSNEQGKPQGAYLDLDNYLDATGTKRGKGGYAKPYPPFYVLRPDGTTLYTLRDVAYSMKKISEADIVLNVICTEQNLPQEKVALTLKALGIENRPQFHMAYELVKLMRSGRIQRMSGRRGIYVLADELYEQLKEATKKVMEDRSVAKINMDDQSIVQRITHTVANASMKYSLLSVSPRVPINFDIDQAVDPTGNSAAFILYSAARISSILAKFDIGVKNGKYQPEPAELNWDLLNDDQAWEIMTKYIIPFKEIVRSTIPQFENGEIPPEPKLPDFGTHVIPTYAFNLSRVFSSYYGRVKVLSGDESMYVKVRFCRAVLQVLHNALRLFMVEPLESM